jgi:hypothetical protein
MDERLEERRRSIGLGYWFRHRWTGEPPPPSYCSDGLNALLGRTTTPSAASSPESAAAQPPIGGTQRGVLPERRAAKRDD